MQKITKLANVFISTFLVASCAADTSERTKTTVNGVDFRDVMAGGEEVNVSSMPTNIGRFLDPGGSKATQYTTADDKILVTKYGPSTTRHRIAGDASVFDKPRSYYYDKKRFADDYSVIKPEQIKTIKGNPYGIYIQSDYTCAIRVILHNEDYGGSESGERTSIELNGCKTITESIEYIVTNVHHH